jgi:hypothetical protein
MTENVIQKSADQILEEIFSTLVSEPITTVSTASDSSSFPSNEPTTPKTDTSKCHIWKQQSLEILWSQHFLKIMFNCSQVHGLTIMCL